MILYLMLKSLFTSKSIQSVTLDDISFCVKHTKRKNIKRIILRVNKKHEIRLSSSKVSMQRLETFIYEQKEWILNQHHSLNVPFEEGTDFYHLAKKYTIHHHSGSLKISGDKLFLDPLRAKKQSDDFYKDSAKDYLKTRTQYWKEEMEVEFSALHFRCAKRRWGSCNSKGVITLNPYMMKLDHEMIDYVIVHELSHLSHMNHSKAFYSHVQKYIPNYRVIQERIKRLSQEMN